MKLYCQSEFRDLARQFADEYRFHLAEDETPVPGDDFLYLDEGGLSLRQAGKKAPGPVRVDFAAGSVRHRRLYGGGKSQAIARAIGIRDGIRPSVADLTAGMGGDAFVLASLGCAVSLLERNPVVCALLRNGLDRARVASEDDPGLGDILGRMTLFQMDSRQWLESRPAGEAPDVIYLDPMFPERRKAAQVNKTMQAFQRLVGDDMDADGLLLGALASARFRVVVKRPAHAPWLAGLKPGHVLEGKSVRFDIYPLKALASS